MPESDETAEAKGIGESLAETGVGMAVLEQIGECVIIADAAGRIAFVNDAARRLHGVSETGVGLEGWSDRYNLFTMSREPYPAEELPLARALLRRETVRDALWRIRRPDGTEVVAQGTAVPLMNAAGAQLGAALMARDVTALHESTLALQFTARALRESEDHFRHIIELNPQVLWTAGTDGGILDFNQRWLDLTGLTREQALGGGWAQVQHSEDLPLMAARWTHAVQTGDVYDVEHRIRLADGSYRWMRSRAWPRRDADGQIVLWYGSTEDIEERKQAELAQETMVAKQRQFVREMLLGFTEGTLRLCDSEDDLPPELTPASEMVALSTATLRLIRKRAEEVAQSLHFPRERWNDLETAIGEATMNAVRHGENGQARVFADPDKALIQIRISDTGPGIAADLIHRAVERNWTTGGFGQGFWLILKTCDRVYLLTNAEGTTVVLEQQQQAPDPTWILDRA